MNSPFGVLPAGLEHLSVNRGEQKKDDNKLGQEDFLELMVAQLENQDPLNPAESGEFLGQIAQFGTVNGIAELQASVSALANSLQSNQALQVSTMVGRSVLVAGDTAMLNGGAGISGAVDLSEQTGSLVVKVHDSAGQLVKTVNLGSQSAGLVQFTWDGLDDAGAALGSGPYQLTAEAAVQDQNVSFPTLIEAQVDSVTLSASGVGPQLNLRGIGPVSLEDVRQVM